MHQDRDKADMTQEYAHLWPQQNQANLMDPSSKDSLEIESVSPWGSHTHSQRNSLAPLLSVLKNK